MATAWISEAEDEDIAALSKKAGSLPFSARKHLDAVLNRMSCAVACDLKDEEFDDTIPGDAVLVAVPVLGLIDDLGPLDCEAAAQAILAALPGAWAVGVADGWAAPQPLFAMTAIERRRLAAGLARGMEGVPQGSAVRLAPIPALHVAPEGGSFLHAPKDGSGRVDPSAPGRVLSWRAVIAVVQHAFDGDPITDAQQIGRTPEPWQTSLRAPGAPRVLSAALLHEAVAHAAADHELLRCATVLLSAKNATGEKPVVHAARLGRVPGPEGEGDVALAIVSPDERYVLASHTLRVGFLDDPSLFMRLLDDTAQRVVWHNTLATMPLPQGFAPVEGEGSGTDSAGQGGDNTAAAKSGEGLRLAVPATPPV